MSKKYKYLVLGIIVFGFIYKLLLTSGGGFLFNMDNARDLVDVREMVVLQKPRLIGPNSAIEGVFNGPGWYLLLAMPFIISGGNPYSTIILQIVLWSIGGYFLFKLTSKYGLLPTIFLGAVWIASNYINLATSYAFNPNPVTLLTPLFIYLLMKYLESGKLFYSMAVFLLGGLFFNFEMNFGVFTPAIIFIALVFSKNQRYLKSINFWIGVGVFAMTLLPQLAFDLKHDFIMSKSLIRYLSEPANANVFDPLGRTSVMINKFVEVFTPTLMNLKLYTQLLIGITILSLLTYFKNKEKEHDLLPYLLIIYILIPFIGYVLIPTSVNPWHLGGVAVAFIMLASFGLYKFLRSGLIGTIMAFSLTIVAVFFASGNVLDYFNPKVDMDPSSYRNEVAAIDYVYQKADGQNFKAYAYLPSVIDYPYQYLFWWYGKKRYGYIPLEYVYSPHRPQYISNKDKFNGNSENYEGLVFLIKEPDRIGYREAWEGDFVNMKFISKEMVGPLEVEIRQELKK